MTNVVDITRKSRLKNEINQTSCQHTFGDMNRCENEASRIYVLWYMS